MSLQQANAQQRGASSGDGADAAGVSGEPGPPRAGREPVSPASDPEHKRRRTSEGEATDARRAEDAAADLEEAIRRSLRDTGGPSGTASGSGGGAYPTYGRTVAASAPVVDAASLAAAFAAASASSAGRSAGDAGARNRDPTHPDATRNTPRDENENERDERRTTVSTGSGVPVRRPALLSAPADEKWWLDETSVDVARDESRVPASAACPDARLACALLTELFGCAVADGSADARSQAPDKNAIYGIPIPFSKSGGAEDGAVSVSRRVVDAALASRVSPARLRGVESLPSTLAAVHFRAVAVESKATNDDSDSWSSTLARLVRFACAEKLTRALEDDGDDLYFEGGRHRSAFFKDLGERASRRDAATDAHVALMLDDMLDVCETSEKARRAWLDVVRAAFGLAANAKLDAVDGLDVPVAAIGALFSRPRIVSAFRESLRAEALDAFRFDFDFDLGFLPSLERRLRVRAWRVVKSRRASQRPFARRLFIVAAVFHEKPLRQKRRRRVFVVHGIPARLPGEDPARGPGEALCHHAAGHRAHARRRARVRVAVRQAQELFEEYRPRFRESLDDCGA
jgi:hypothetical protein